MATLEDQYRLMTDKDPLALPQMDGPITPDLQRYGMPPPGTGGGAPYTPQEAYMPAYAYDMQQNRFAPMTANQAQQRPQFRSTATRLGPDEPRPQFRATPPRPGPYIENIQGGAAQERQGYSMARRNDVSPRFGAWLTGTDLENANPNQISSLRSFYGPASQQEISLPGLRGTGPRTQFQVSPERMPPMRGANGLPVGYSPTPEEQARAKARLIAEQTSGVQKITGGVSRPTAGGFGFGPRGAAYDNSSFLKKGGSEGEYQRQQAAPRAPVGDAFGFAPRGPVYESPPFVAEQYAGTQKPAQTTTQPQAPQAGQAAAPRQAAPRGTGIFYSRSGVEGTQQQYVPGTLGEVTPEQRVQMAMQRFAPEVAIGPNGQRMQLPTDREVGPYSPGAVANQQAIRRAAEGMSAGMFQTRGAREAAMKQSRESDLAMQARAAGKGMTKREQAEYMNALRNLSGPQAQERRAQERAAERIAKASNPPQAVRGEKPEVDKDFESMKSSMARNYSEENQYSPGASAAVQGIIMGLQSEAEVRDFNRLMSLDPNTASPQEKKARMALYGKLVANSGAPIADEVMNLTPQEMEEYQREKAARQSAATGR